MEKVPGGPSDALLRGLVSADHRRIVREVLDRSPEVARARHLAAAAEARAPQVSAFPDPVAALGVFVLPPETRAGPQRLSASIQQRLPWLA
ncbi:MAG: hypothetical protein MI919_39335, partial [Holophagales bacterium]|nr:hypothetical protein [Holophagales bacterium]